MFGIVFRNFVGSFVRRDDHYGETDLDRTDAWNKEEVKNRFIFLFLFFHRVPSCRISISVCGSDPARVRLLVEGGFLSLSLSFILPKINMPVR